MRVASLNRYNEITKVFPDDLLARPTEHPFSLGTPVYDGAARVELYESIERRLDNGPPHSLAFEQRLLRNLSRADVAGDFGGADDHSRF